jgi:thymidylate kinase
LDNLDKKRKAYLDMTEEENMIVVDGFGTREEVHEEIKKRLRQVL